MTATFDHLLLLGRPAAGKSEFIDYMKKTSDGERSSVFHIGRFEGIDDFFWLWEKFLEDDMWEKAGYERMFSFSDKGNYSVRPDKGFLFDLMFTKFNHTIKEKYLSRPEFYKDQTLLVEFSRGGENGYRNALTRLSKEVLSRAAILYVKVDFEESWRRNVKRYEEKLKASSLAHMVPRDVMERFYKTDDWEKITDGREFGTVSFHGIEIPFATMDNVPELPPGPEISKRYQVALDGLWRARPTCRRGGTHENVR